MAKAEPSRGPRVPAIPAIVREADPVTFRTTFVSPQARDLLGYEPETWTADPHFWTSRIHPADRRATVAATEIAVRDGSVGRIDYRFRAADGRYRWIRDTVQVVVDGRGRRLVGVMLEVTDAPHGGVVAETVASAIIGPDGTPAADAQVREVLENLADGVYFVDPKRRITYWNRGAERLTGYRSAEVVGRSCFDNILCHVDAGGTQLCHHGCPLSAAIGDGSPHDAQVWLRHADGSRRAVQARVSPVRNAAGRIIGGVEVFSDATGLVEAQDAAEAARRDAFTDPLTGLPNRRLLDAVLASRKDALDQHGQPFGMLIVDIDFFKRFNDEHGHDVGDQAILVVASTLRAAARGGDAVTRWGGEEFAIVAAQVDAAGLQRVGERMLRLVRAAQVPTDHGPLTVRVSIGGSLAVPDEPLADLFVRADQALLAAKQGGRDRFVLDHPA